MSRFLRPLVAACTLALGACGQPSPNSEQTSFNAADGGTPPSESPPPQTIPSSLVPFEIVRHEDPGCIAPGKASSSALDVDEGTRLVDLAGTGSHLFARNLVGGNVLSFVDGKPSGALSLGSETRVAVSDSGVIAAGVGSGNRGIAQRFDLGGKAVGKPEDLGAVQLGRPIGLGRNHDSSLVVWAPPDDSLRARVIVSSGATSNVTLESAAAFGDLSLAVLPSNQNASHFIVVWALYRIPLDAYRVYAALLDERGLVGLPRVLFGSEAAIRVIGSTKTASGGALVVEYEGEPLIVPLDDFGRISAKAHLLLGTRSGGFGGVHGIAGTDDALGIIGEHASGALAFRRLDPTGAPLGKWTCLDETEPDEFRLGAIAANGNGYTVFESSSSHKDVRVHTLDASGQSE